MLLIIAFGILLCTPVIMLILHWTALRFNLHWPLAILGALSAWVLVLVARPSTIQTIPLMDWQKSLSLPSPALLLDPVSWPFAFVVTTITLAVLLTAVARQRETENWSTWGGSLAVGAFGLAAVLAANPLTIIIGWAALDFSELAILLSQENQSLIRQRILVTFASRQTGVLVLLGAVIYAQSIGTQLTFTSIPALFSPYILIAAGLRLGIFPLQPLILSDSSLQRGLGTSLRLGSAASSLVLITRSALYGTTPALAPYILVLCSLIAFLSSISWLTAENEIPGRSYWILGCASLAVAAAIRGQPTACLSWGVASLLAGSSLMLYAVRHRFLMILPLISLVFLTGLPFTPTWSSLDLYSPLPNSGVVILDWIVNSILFLSLLLLLVGYLRHATRSTHIIAGPERWIWIIYPLGLLLIPVVMVVTEIIQMPALQSLPFWKWGLGFLSTLLTILFWTIIFRREQQALDQEAGSSSMIRGSAIWGELLSLQWSRRVVLSIFRFLEFVLQTISRILEGQAGILWTFVFLAFLFFLILPSSLGK